MITPRFSIDMSGVTKGIRNVFDAAEAMAKSNSGTLAAKCRATAKNSMKKAAKLSKKMQAAIKAMGAGTASLPGNPPLERTGALKTFVLFAWDEKTKSYVIGPKRLPRIGLQAKSLEFGVPTVANVLDGNKRKVVKIPMRARPFMAPALAKTMTPANVKKVYEKSLKRAVKSSLKG